MNAESENLITLSVVGIESEGGHVRADELLDELSNLLEALNRFDRIVSQTGSPTLYYRIIAVHHASPLSITLEPVVRHRIQKPATDHITIRHARFFKELEAIRRNEPLSPEVDDQLLEHLSGLTA